ncbi:MAG: ABC transporter ATP-binding protein [Aquiluna sp.]|nr:ABC transporter ATP-binding protein [Aquiluna sp.]MCF8545308.1 ABC transporter ATP-binding protein [Aquiluna sp.]
MESQNAIIKASEVSVDFWVDGSWVMAASGVNFEVKPGEVLAIVGESGSGKSTTAMSLLGLLPVNGRASGSVLLQGEELIGASKKRLREIRGKDIAVIFQEPMTALNPVYTIGFQIVEALQVHYPRMTKAQAKTRALELLNMVELPDPEKAFNSYPHQLSGGQRQRAMIAQSISCDPLLLIADEPTTALDVTVQAEILDLLRNLKQRLNSAVILITHDMGVVADLSDNMIVMKDGVVLETGTTDKIFNDPSNQYTKDLLAAVPHLGAAQAQGRAAIARENVQPTLRLEAVDIEYPKRGKVPAFKAVQSASLEIYPGEVLGLVGESGSGKTTIGRVVVGLLPVKSGNIEISGKSMVNVSKADLMEVRRNIGIVFQDPGSSLNPRWPIGQSIAEPLLLAGQNEPGRTNRVSELLDMVELPKEYRNRYPHELSGGQRQRVGIARALALSPKLLVADEPTSALDVSVQARVLELLQEIQKELQFATLFISHDLAVVDLLSDRIAVMQHGVIVEQGDRDQILRNPLHEYTKKLIAAVPVPDPAEQKARRAARATH